MGLFLVQGVPYGTLQKFNRCSTPIGEINDYVSGYSTIAVHDILKNSVDILPSPKKYIFLFLITVPTSVVHGTWYLTLTDKKNTVSDYTTNYP